MNGTHAALGFAAEVAVLSMQETTEIYEGFLVLSAVFASLMPVLDEENGMIYSCTMEKISPEKRRKRRHCSVIPVRRPHSCLVKDESDLP